MVRLNRFYTLRFMGPTEGSQSVPQRFQSYQVVLKYACKSLNQRFLHTCQGRGVSSILICTRESSSRGPLSRESSRSLSTRILQCSDQQRFGYQPKPIRPSRFLGKEVQSALNVIPESAHGNLDRQAWLQGAPIWITPVRPIQSWADTTPTLTC